MLRSLNREIGIYGIVLLGFYLQVLSVRAWVIWWAGPGPGLGGVHRDGHKDGHKMSIGMTIVMGHGGLFQQYHRHHNCFVNSEGCITVLVCVGNIIGMGHFRADIFKI